MTRSKREKKKKVSGAIEWTERALTDLRAIDDYIAVDNPVAAERWIGRLIAKAEGAARLPLAGRIVPEKAQADVREVFVSTTAAPSMLTHAQVVAAAAPTAVGAATAPALA